MTQRVSNFESSPYVTLIRISANVDGSDQFIFTPRSVRWKHKFWSDPTDVKFNGKPWTDLHHSPPGWQHLSRHLDLSRAWIVKRQGRDVVALERTANGFELYFCDSPNETAHYSAVIAVPRRVGAAPVAAEPPPFVPGPKLIAPPPGALPLMTPPPGVRPHHRGEAREGSEEHHGEARGGWEYKVVKVWINTGGTGQQINDLAKTGQQINDLAKSGWSLVTFSAGRDDSAIVVFKKHN